MTKNQKKLRYEAPRLSDLGVIALKTEGVNIGQPEIVGTDLFPATAV